MARPSRTGGKTSEAKARNASPAKGRKTTKTKRRIAPAATRVKRRSVSGPSKDLKEAREQQAATAEILKVIAGSPNDVQPVFEAIVASANRLIGGYTTAVFRFIDGYGHLAAFTPINPDADEKLKAAFPQRSADVPIFRPAQAGEVLQIDDTEKSHERLRDIARARGFRSVLYVPLKSKETSIGVIATNRRTPGPFSAHDVQLLQTFADQAVIAIENVRLFDEVQAKTRDLTESLQQQTATADVLKVISRSAFDLQTVLETLVESACPTMRGGHSEYLAAGRHHFPSCCELWLPWQIQERLENAQYLVSIGIEPDRGSIVGRVLLERRTVQVHDVQADPEYELIRSHTHRGLPDGAGRAAVTRRRFRSASISFALQSSTFYRQTHRFGHYLRRPGRDRHRERRGCSMRLQARTEDLRESLQQQTATADVLKVISRSTFDLQTVSANDSSNRRLGSAKPTRPPLPARKIGVFFRAEAYGFSD